MATVALSIDEALELLKERTSVMRRRGAARLKQLEDPNAGREIRAALERELQDARTWETQYVMVSALGVSGAMDDRNWLKRVAHMSREHTMVNVAIGEAIVRLSRDDEEAAVAWCLEQSVDLLAEGAQRAVAQLRLKPSASTKRLLMSDADERLSDPAHPNDTLGLWVIIAAAGWGGADVAAFLQRYREDKREDVTKAAGLALNGEYMRI